MICGWIICFYPYIGTGIYSTTLIFALKKQARNRIRFPQAIPNAGSEARSLPQTSKKIILLTEKQVAYAEYHFGCLYNLILQRLEWSIFDGLT